MKIVEYRNSGDLGMSEFRKEKLRESENILDGFTWIQQRLNQTTYGGKPFFFLSENKERFPYRVFIPDWFGEDWEYRLEE